MMRILDTYTYRFLGDDGELARVDALLGELPRRVPLRAGTLVVSSSGGDRRSGGDTRIEGTAGEKRAEGYTRTAATPPPRMTYLKCFAIPHPTIRQAGRQAGCEEKRNETRRSRRTPTDGRRSSTGGEAEMEWSRIGGRGEDRVRWLTFYTRRRLPRPFPASRGEGKKKGRGCREGPILSAFRSLRFPDWPLPPRWRFALMQAQPPRGAVPRGRTALRVIRHQLAGGSAHEQTTYLTTSMIPSRRLSFFFFSFFFLRNPGGFLSSIF